MQFKCPRWRLQSLPNTCVPNHGLCARRQTDGLLVRTTHSYLKKTGIIRMARMLTTLIMGFTAGPAVSL